MSKTPSALSSEAERISFPIVHPPSNRLQIFGLGIIAFVVPLTAYTFILLHHFYVQGSYFFDSGLQASLIWHSDAILTTPPLLGTRSFFETHFSPFFLVLSALSWILPLSMAQYFALVLAFGHAVPTIAVYGCLVKVYGMRTGLKLLTAALLGIAFSFNGLALAIIRFPHVEILFVASAMLFLLVVSLEVWPAAILCFVVTLSMREDAGFHLFALLFMLTITDVVEEAGQSRRRALVGFATVSLTYSFVALLTQKWLFSGGGSFARIYLGEPAFEHLTWSGPWIRFFGYFAYRPYVMFPAVCAMIAAFFMRNPYIILGYAAFLPWLVLHLLADSQIAGTLSIYYAFPFMLAAFWPLLIAMTSRARAKPQAIISLFIVMIITSWIGLSRQYNPGKMDIWASLSPPSAERQHVTDQLITRLVAAHPCVGALAVENAVLALSPRAFRQADLVVPNMYRDFDTVAYFEQGFDRDPALRLIASNHLNLHYQIIGTSIRIATRLPIEACGFGDRLKPDPDFAPA